MNDFMNMMQEALISAFAEHDGHEIKEVETDEWRCLTCKELICMLSDNVL